MAFPKLVPATAQAATLALKLPFESPSDIKSFETVVIKETGTATLTDEKK
jgi:hypothetical protein